MTSLAGVGVGGGPSRAVAVPSGAPLRSGRVVYADRVFTKIAEQAASQIIGVPRHDVGVDVHQYADGLALSVRTPLPVPSLDDRAGIDSGPPVLERVATIQQSLRGRVGELTGREVVRVDVTVSGAVTAVRRRVR